MKRKKVFFKAGILLLSLLLLPGLLGCGAISNLMATPTPTATSTPTPTLTPTLTPTSTSTPTPLPPIAIPLIVYNPHYQMYTTFERFSTPGQHRWEIANGTIEGDISGSQYTFEMSLACIGQGQFIFKLILERTGPDQLLAEAEFSVTGEEFRTYTQTVNGVDPDSRRGDKLLLEADVNLSEDCGIRFDQSQVFIPGVRR